MKIDKKRIINEILKIIAFCIVYIVTTVVFNIDVNNLSAIEYIVLIVVVTMSADLISHFLKELFVKKHDK